MNRTRPLSVLILAALLVLPATGSLAWGGLFRLVPPEIEGYTTSANVVYVTVSNPGTTSQSCSVLVQAVVAGTAVAVVVTQSIPPGRSATLPVPLPDTPSVVTHVGLTTEGPAPI